MRAIVIIFSMILTGCMSMSIPDFQNVTTHRQGSLPDIDKETTTDVGSIIYTEFDYQEFETIRLTNDLNSSVADISTSTPLIAMRMDGDLVYTPFGTVNSSRVLLSDEDKNGRIERIKDISNLNSRWINLQPAVPYEDAENISTQNGGLKLELVYQGRTGNTIKVLYREYIDDIARPAFSQAVEYDLDDDGTGTIAFKGARIDVLEATSTEITYEVIRGFDN